MERSACTKIRTLITVYADPNPSGFFTMKSENFVKLDPGTEGIVEYWEKTGRARIKYAVIRFPGNIRARLNENTFEVIV